MINDYLSLFIKINIYIGNIMTCSIVYILYNVHTYMIQIVFCFRATVIIDIVPCTKILVFFAQQRPERDRHRI